MTRILVTGGAGYIGSILVPMLLEKGQEVIVLDNFMYGQTSLLDCCHNPRLRIIRGDVRDKKLIEGPLAKSDIIIPLACIVGADACDRDPIAAKSVNLDAIYHILARRSRNQKVIFPNTNSGYGIGQSGIFCDENSELKPVSLYGKLKVEAENNVLLKYDSGDAIALRLATVFGASPRMRLDLLVNDFVHKAVTDGYIELSESHFKRNYIHVRDVARAFIHCIENFESMNKKPFNVGLSDANLSKMELCLEIKKQIPNLRIYENESRKDPDQRNYIVSNAKIEATGFKPETSLQDGIAELIKAYQIIKNNKFANT